jgi:CRP/FNR family transcriptional regulator, cyclic AMP receptor protein
MLFFDLFRHDPKLLEVAAGLSLFREGEAGDAMYVLVSGSAEIRFAGLILEEVAPGGIVGELGVIDASPRTATVIARSDCVFAVIDQKRFRFLVEETPNFALEVMRVMADRLRHCDQRLRESSAR